MAKEKRILIYFISFLLGFFLIMFIGISGVFAATYQMNYNYEQRYYDNYGSSVVQVPTSWMDSFGSYVSNEITTYANSYGAGLSITSPIPLLSGHTYSFSVYFEGIFNIALSSKNEISIASSLNAAANDYANNIPGTELLYSKVSNNSILQFVFKADNNHTHLFFPWTTTSTTTQSYVVTEIVMEDLGSSGVSEQDINNSLNNQTNEINNSIENSTNTITGSINETENNINQNIDDMEQSIVDSNKETQDVIKDQFNSCRDSNNLFNATLINSTSGIIVNKDGSKITLPKATSGNGFTDTHTKLSVLAPELKVGDVVYLNFNTNSSYNKFIYLVTPQLVWYDGTSITITQEMLNSKVGFYGNRFTNGEDYQVIISDLIMSYKNTSFEPYGEICNNKIDDTNNKLDGIQGALTDSSAPNISGLENSAGWLPAGPLDSILNLPLTMLNSLTNSLTKTCAPLNLTLPYVNKNIQIPCLSAIFAQITGVNGLWTWVGTIASVLILYNYLLNLYAWVDRVLTLRAEFDEAMGADLANWGRL